MSEWKNSPIECEVCGKKFIKTNRSNRCPRCRETGRTKRVELADGDKSWDTLEEKTAAADKRQKGLIDTELEARKQGKSYGQLQAERAIKSMRNRRISSQNIAEIKVEQKRERARASAAKRKEVKEEMEKEKQLEKSLVADEDKKKAALEINGAVIRAVKLRRATIETEIKSFEETIKDLRNEIDDLDRFLKETDL